MKYPTYLPTDFVKQDDKARFKSYLDGFKPLGSDYEPTKAAPDLFTEAARIAREKGYDDDAGRVAQAILRTEGALSGEIGDAGKSHGPYQFHEGGMLPAYAKALGMDVRGAAEHARKNPTHAIGWALGGYLGNAIREGQAKGLRGAELATYAQQHGQRSQAPERAGQNYSAMFGGGAPIPAHAPTTIGPREAAIPAHTPVDDKAEFGKYLSSFPELGSDLQMGKERAIPAHEPKDDKQAFGEFLDSFPKLGGDLLGGAAKQLPFVGPALKAMGQQQEYDEKVVSPQGELMYGPLLRGETLTKGLPGIQESVVRGGAKYGPMLFERGLGETAAEMTKAEEATPEPIPGVKGALRLGVPTEALANLVGPVEGARAVGALERNLPRIAEAAGKALPEAGRLGRALAGEAGEQLLERTPMRTFAGDLGKGVEDVSRKAAKEPWEMTASDIEARYPNAGATVDGRTVGKTVKNQSSIEASIDNPTALEGIREVPISAFEDSGPPKFYSSSEEARTRQLAEQIQQSGHIDPLIVVDDAQGSPYILEGGHRFDALKILGAKSFPAQVVVDEDAYYKAAKEALASGRSVPPEVLADYPDLAASQAPIKQIASEPPRAGESPIRPLAEQAAETSAEEGLQEAVGQMGPPTGAKPIILSREEEIERLRLQDFPEWLHEDLIKASENDDWHRAQRRGVIPTAVSEEMADELTLTVEQAIKEGKAGRAYNSEQIRALGNLVTTQAYRAKGLAQEVAATQAKGEATDSLIVQALREGQKLADLQRVYEGGRAEWGRAGLAWQVGRRTVESPIEDIQRIYKALGGRDNALNAVIEYNQMVAQGANPMQMANFWAKVEKPPPGFQDWFRALRYNSMMSGPRTVEINIIGNSLEIPWRLARDFGASTLRGRPQEIAPEIAGIWIGAQRGARNLMEVMRYGITKEQSAIGDVPASLAARTEGRVARGVATALEVPTRINQAFDEFAKATAYSMIVGRRAAVKASKEGKRGADWNIRVAELLENPDKLTMREATEGAERMTYKGDMGVLGDALGGVQRVPYLGNVLLPFLRTVYHITARGIDRSPLGAIGTGIDWARGAYKGGKVPKGAAPLGERLGDNIMGGLAGLGFTYWAMQGNLSGAGPDDPQKRDLLRAQGWMPYSAKIGDQWISYSNWGPVAIPLAQAAAVAEANLYKKPDDSAMGIAMDAFRRFGELATEQVYLQGIGNFYKAIADPEIYGGRWLTGFAQSLVPYGAGIATAAQAGDPYQRQPEKYNIGQALATRFPGVREGVPIQQDVLGREVPNVLEGGKAFQPLRMNTVKDDAVLKALTDVGVDISKPPKSWRGISLTPDEQREFQRIAGPIIEKGVKRQIGGGLYAIRLPEQKAKVLQTIVDTAREQAGLRVLQNIGLEERRRRKREAARGVR